MKKRRDRRVRIGALGLSIAALVVAGAGCEGRPRSTTNARVSPALSGPAVVEIDLSRGAPESSQGGLFGSSRGRTHAELVQVIGAANERETTKGFFVKLGTAGLGLARANEVGRLLASIRKAKKPVVCHADDLGNATLLLASMGCDRVWVSPAGGVESVGIAAELVFGNRLLEKLHVEVNFLQVGKYKGAQEPFTRDSASPEARQSVEGALRGLRSAWLSAITEGRGKPELADLVEDGPFAPEEAKAKGLVDEIGYADEAREEAKKLAGAERVSVRFGGSASPEPVSGGIIDVIRVLAGPGSGGEPHVAIVPATGAISMGGAPSSPLGGSDGINERDLGKTIARLEKDESTKAVVLRIDSPGGSALASDLLWKRLMKLRGDKPLVVSVGGMAASGGYYLACAGTKIVAEPTSILGSIGVVSGKLAVGKTLAEIGVTTETIAAAPDPLKAKRATYMSPFQGWDEPTRQKVLGSMQSIYDVFVRRISEGRGMAVEKVAESAEGRIFGGVEAKERGLVDELGGLVDAVTLARKLAHLPDDAPAEVVGEGSGLLDLLEAAEDGDAGAAQESKAAKAARQAAVDALLPEVGALLPEVARYLGSMAPFLSGERTLAAMPFGLIVR
ncbi:signal peptide peptidase SppA [Polyangium mundeleinium]|uniref:Signal peptide peptidase SppA n=1 Tax=Polyangium mundeleinium TaxID=2995306 RepID=A0ABT5EJM2_9BACT|nr:signal peptide peptidase SppA [Polyangium mundeleinium]MDC0741147.1 signal peptide peptidase SppA [Polyangium mundeleinium]